VKRLLFFDPGKFFSALGPNVIFELRKQHQERKARSQRSAPGDSDDAAEDCMSMGTTWVHWIFLALCQKRMERRLGRDPGDILPP
jgi:hypothetical protein